MAITPAQIKELRERTGVGMARCKSALVEAEGDINAAIELLRKQGMASAVKKESRETNEGTVNFKENDSHIAVIKVNVETDFVVKNNTFQEFVGMLLDQALLLKPTSIENFLSQQVSEKDGSTVDQLRAEKIQSLGENIVISSIELIEKEKNTSYGIYRHTNGKVLSIVVLSGSDDVVKSARNIGMHVVAAYPEYLSPADVPQSILDAEEAIVRELMKDKPEHLLEKIIPGKLNQFAKEKALTHQVYVMDSKKTISEVVAELGKEAGKELSLSAFYRYEVGQ